MADITGKGKEGGGGSLKENLIDRLKVKEEEMDALIEDARKKAASIKKDALEKAAGLKGAALEKIDAEVEAARAAAEDAIMKEVEAFEHEARAGAAELREKGLSRIERAVERILSIVAEGIDDREDDKDTDHRP
ncbi:MAG: hypothetical protein BMS9Abin23_0506 [Thermodesulfobacteriota bacterium]|nr:MAG: hypothetical protein BMS9Abin23_0506 [Thermodesulfobacteriota bacterium]